MENIKLLIKNELISLKAVKDSDRNLVNKVRLLLKMAEFLDNQDRIKLVNNIAIIPDQGYGYTNIHIMSDCESGDMAYWQEVKFEDNHIRLIEGDMIIEFR